MHPFYSNSSSSPQPIFIQLTSFKILMEQNKFEQVKEYLVAES